MLCTYTTPTDASVGGYRPSSIVDCGLRTVDSGPPIFPLPLFNLFSFSCSRYEPKTLKPDKDWEVRLSLSRIHRIAGQTASIIEAVIRPVSSCSLLVAICQRCSLLVASWQLAVASC